MCYHINGAVVQELNRPTRYLEIPNVSYFGINAFFHDPLCGVTDYKLRQIAAQAMEKEYADGSFALLNFITAADLLFKYLQACREAGIAIRVLFVKSNYADELWEGEFPISRFLGYEYCEIPFDSQIVTDFNWYTPLKAFHNSLNHFGLFDTIEKAEEFKKAYDAHMMKGMIGDGEMDAFICEVYEVDIDNFILTYQRNNE